MIYSDLLFYICSNAVNFSILTISTSTILPTFNPFIEALTVFFQTFSFFTSTSNIIFATFSRLFYLYL